MSSSLKNFISKPWQGGHGRKMSHSTIGGGGVGGGGDYYYYYLTHENTTHEEVCFTDCYTRVLTAHQS
jgi:hypothetical protein